MSQIIFKVDNFHIDLGHKLKGPENVSLCSGLIVLHGAKKGHFYICGLHPQSPTVHAGTDSKIKEGWIFVPMANFHTYVDLVKSEPDLWVLMDTGDPMHNNMITTLPIA